MEGLGGTPFAAWPCVLGGRVHPSHSTGPLRLFTPTSLFPCPRPPCLWGGLVPCPRGPMSLAMDLLMQ
jgi:hypothetical protein